MTTTKGGMSPREIALDVLLEVLERGGFSHVILRQALTKYQYLDKQDRAFITRLVEGTLEYCIQLDYVINRYSKTLVKKMKPLIRTLLRMSVYQLLYMDRVPDSAVCNEAVKLSKARRFQGLSGFVNGILRTISREKEKLSFPDLSIRYAVPDWMVKLWERSYEKETVETMLGSFLAQQPLTVRCDLGKADRGQIMEGLRAQGVTAEECPYLPEFLYLSSIDHLEALSAFRDGLIFPQDVSSGLAVRAAGIRSGERILDVCGAPGGKALYGAELLSGTGQVTVRDLSQQKVFLIQENIERMGAKNIQAETWDALVFDESWKEQADLVIADLPCSGLGIMGKKPDIKLNMTEAAAKELALLQRRILSVVWQYVKPGGRILFSTCTIDPAENEENYRWFLSQYPFRPVDLSGRLGEAVTGDTLKEGYFQILPGIYPMDGFFLSVAEREK